MNMPAFIGSPFKVWHLSFGILEIKKLVEAENNMNNENNRDVFDEGYGEEDRLKEDRRMDKPLNIKSHCKSWVIVKH